MEKVDKVKNIPEKRRSLKDWLLLALFYTVLYICLSGFFAIMMLGLMATINDREPKYILEKSIIGTSPGISFLPRPEDVQSSLIIINDKFDWKYWGERFNKTLQPYLKIRQTHNTETSIKECNNGMPPINDLQFCQFNPVNLSSGSTCNEDNYFGYLEGEPCLMFKLNKIYGWEPKPYTDISVTPQEYRDIRGNKFDPNHIGVTCEGAFPADKEHIGSVDYFPEYGFPTHYFPFRNQQGYLSPLVMVQFKNLTRNVLISVECKLWATNIEHDRYRRRGYIRLELMVD